MYRQFETFKNNFTWNELKEQRDKNQIELDKRIASLKAFRKKFPAKIHPNKNFKYIDQKDQKIIKSIKQVSESLPLSLSISTKLDTDKLFEKLGFENMGSNWRLK